MVVLCGVKLQGRKPKMAWGNCSKISSDMDLTGAPYTSAPSQGTAPTNANPIADGWFPIANFSLALGNRRVLDELYLFVYTDATDVDIVPWFYCPEAIPEGDPLVGKHVSGRAELDIPATASPTGDKGSVYRIPILPFATHVRIERGTQTGGTYCKGNLFMAEDVD